MQHYIFIILKEISVRCGYLNVHARFAYAALWPARLRVDMVTRKEYTCIAIQSTVQICQKVEWIETWLGKTMRPYGIQVTAL